MKDIGIVDGLLLIGLVAIVIVAGLTATDKTLQDVLRGRPSPAAGVPIAAEAPAPARTFPDPGWGMNTRQNEKLDEILARLGRIEEQQKTIIIRQSAPEIERRGR